MTSQDPKAWRERFDRQFREEPNKENEEMYFEFFNGCVEFRKGYRGYDSFMIDVGDFIAQELAQVEAKARLNLLNEVRGLVEGMRERECFCNSCYSRTVIKGKPTRSPHCENSGYDTALDNLLSALNKLETTGQEEV